MSAGRRLAAAIRRTGDTVVLLRGGERVPFTASIQPELRMKEEAASPIGWGAPGEYTLYAAGDAPEPLPGERLEWRGRFFRVRRAETVYLGAEPFYRRAALYGETEEES